MEIPLECYSAAPVFFPTDCLGCKQVSGMKSGSFKTCISKAKPNFK